MSDDVALFCVSLMAKLGSYPKTCSGDFTLAKEVCDELDIDFEEVLEHFDRLDPRCDCGFFSDD